MTAAAKDLIICKGVVVFVVEKAKCKGPVFGHKATVFKQESKGLLV